MVEAVPCLLLVDQLFLSFSHWDYFLFTYASIVFFQVCGFYVAIGWWGNQIVWCLHCWHEDDHQLFFLMAKTPFHPFPNILRPYVYPHGTLLCFLSLYWTKEFTRTRVMRIKWTSSRLWRRFVRYFKFILFPNKALARTLAFFTTYLDNKWGLHVYKSYIENLGSNSFTHMRVVLGLPS